MLRHIVVVTIVLSAFVPAPPAQSAKRLRAGVAVVDITPPIPYRMSGYFSERLSTGIKDKLQAKAIVFQQENEWGALVFCDLIGISANVSRNARKQASAATGIPVSNIAIAATHSHTGPLYFGALRAHFHNRIVKKTGQDRHEKVDYPAQLAGRIASAVQKAHSNLAEVNLRAGYANEKRLSFNRRFHMKNGGVRFNPGQQNPNIVRVAGPIDPQVGVVLLQASGDDKPLAGLISFALHLDTVGGTEYSADYPVFLEQQLRKSLGNGFISLFGAGTCGDINHVDIRIKGRRSAKDIGTMLAKTVAEQIKKLPLARTPSLAVRSATIRVPLQRYEEAEIAAAKNNMQRVDDRTLSFLERVEAYKISALQLRGGSQMAIEVQAFRLSPDIALVTLPGEVFVELGLAIKAASPFKTTLVIELANDAPGYLPTRKAFAEGSYETVNSRIASGGGEIMVETATRLLRELRR